MSESTVCRRRRKASPPPDTDLARLLVGDLDDPTHRLVLADALAFAGRDGEAALARSEEALMVVAGALATVGAVAGKLNDLHRAAAPLTWRLEQAHGRVGRPHHHVEAILRQANQVCDDALRRWTPLARRQEVLAAAAAGSEVWTRLPHTDWHNIHYYCTSSMARRVLALAWPDVQAWARADDARRLAEYEDFRRLLAPAQTEEVPCAA